MRDGVSVFTGGEAAYESIDGVVASGEFGAKAKF